MAERLDWTDEDEPTAREYDEFYQKEDVKVGDESENLESYQAREDDRNDEPRNSLM
jgi:hypothetical protein